MSMTPYITTPKTQSTQDAGRNAGAKLNVFTLMLMHAVWTSPFTSTGPICSRRIARCVPRPVWIGPKE